MRRAVTQPLLLEFFGDLTSQPKVTSKVINRFIRVVKKRYNEGTLIRLLDHPSSQVREASLIALRFLGTMQSTPAILQCLRDSEESLLPLAEATLWSIWFRADSLEHGEELQRLAALIERKQYRSALIGLNRLIKKAPHFAEAYNQRAVLFWQRKQYERSIEDCKRALELNPFHFGAQAGLGQCYEGLLMPVEALQAFRKALKLHPHLPGVMEKVSTLEELLKSDEE